MLRVKALNRHNAPHTMHMHSCGFAALPDDKNPAAKFATYYLAAPNRIYLLFFKLILFYCKIPTVIINL